MRQQRTIFLILLSTLLIVGYGFYALFWFGTIRINDAGNYDQIILNGNRLQIDQSGNIEARLRPGDHELILSGPFTRRSINETVRVSAFSVKEVNASTTLLSEGELVGILASDDLASGLSLADYSFLEDNEWLVVRLYSPEGLLEGYSNIYRYETRQGWSLIESGTGFNPEELDELGAPLSVTNYIRGIR